jgi:hypothetical protein
MMCAHMLKFAPVIRRTAGIRNYGVYLRSQQVRTLTGESLKGGKPKSGNSDGLRNSRAEVNLNALIFEVTVDLRAN